MENILCELGLMAKYRPLTTVISPSIVYTQSVLHSGFCHGRHLRVSDKKHGIGGGATDSDPALTRVSPMVNTREESPLGAMGKTDEHHRISSQEALPVLQILIAPRNAFCIGCFGNT